MEGTIEERVKVLEKQVKFLRNWIYNVCYPLAPMSVKNVAILEKEWVNLGGLNEGCD